ncbi:MAG TPA: hypothetical protein VKA21_07160 [Candidatus Binatia bacterium]|nr:hypothetical protein [Candidatus Binatia bacterium]
MYELPMTIGLVPGIGLEFAALGHVLTTLGAIWLAVTAVLFLVIIPLAMRRTETDVPVAGRAEPCPTDQRHALPNAA